jgi:lysophospholipase L1-like esterase
MGTNVYLDKNGFRVKDRSINIKKENKKIIMLGDSMTFGWGANSTFSSLLNKKINSYDVLNAGIGNTNTIMQINNFFNNFSDKFNYDIIILNFFINDFENVVIKNPNLLQKYSYLYTFVNNKINTVLIRFKLKDDWKSFYSENYLNLEIKNETLFMINKLNDYCLNNNIKFVIHNIPELRDLNNYKFENETKIIKNLAKSKKILYIDSLDKLKNYKPENLWVTPLDPHANDKAHRIIADNLFENLKSILN